MVLMLPRKHDFHPEEDILLPAGGIRQQETDLLTSSILLLESDAMPAEEEAPRREGGGRRIRGRQTARKGRYAASVNTNQHQEQRKNSEK